MAKIFTADSTIKFFITIIGLVVIAVILKELSHILIPFVIAYLLFFLFSPLNTFLEKKNVPRGLTILTDIIITALIAWGISVFIVDSFLRFSEFFPIYSEKLNNIVRNAAIALGISEPYFKNFSVQELISQIDYTILAGGIFSSTFSFMGGVLFVVFFFVFVATGHKTIYEAIQNRYINKKLKPELKKIKLKYEKRGKKIDADFDQWQSDKLNVEVHEKEMKLAGTFKAITEQIQKYIITKIAVNLAAGILVTLFLYILGVDFPVIWGIFTFLFNFIPTIGSAIALVAPILMTLIQFESFGYILFVAAIIIGIQTVFFNVIEPVMMGKRLNLNPLLILIAVLVWGYIWGIVGMLLAVPLTAILNIIISNSESKNLKFISDLMSEKKK